jgi:hypothetical protein
MNVKPPDPEEKYRQTDLRKFVTAKQQLMKKYTNKLYTPVMVESDEIKATLSQAYPHLKFTSIPEVNQMNSLEAPKGEKIEKLVQKSYHNKHIFSHHIRAISENYTLTEQLNFKKIRYTETIEIPQPKIDDGYGNMIDQDPKEEEIEYLADVPTRPIIDVNSTRLINSNIVDTILIPNVDDADADRIRNVLDLQQEQNAEIDRLAAKVEDDAELIDKINDNKIRTSTYTFQQFFNNFGNFVPRYNNRPEDTLTVLTDVVYYLTNDDLYNATENLSDGTVIIGALHIPKYLDTQEHLIVYPVDGKQFVEGKMKIIPKQFRHDIKYYNQKEVEMLMEMDGNDHIYHHPLRFLELREQRFLPLKSTVNRNYLLKVVVTHRVDTGATYYTSFKIVKISEPSLTDYLNIEQFTDELAETDRYQQVLNKVKSYATQTNADLTADLYRILKMDEPKITNSQYASYIVDIKNSTKTAKKYVKLDPEYKTNTVVMPGNNNINYYIVKRRDGGFIDTRIIFKQSLQQIRDNIEITSVKNTLVNKINQRIVNADRIDAQFIRAMIGFVHREDTSLPIDVIVSLVTKCIFDMTTIESQITLLKEAGITQFMNALKKDTVDIIPNSFWESVFNGKLMNFIQIKIREWAGDKTQDNIFKPLQDFQ